MPAPAFALHRPPSEVCVAEDGPSDTVAHVHVTQDAEDEVAELYKVLSSRPLHQYPETHLAFGDFLQQENAELEKSGIAPARLGVCFKDITTWGAGNTNAPVKTLKHALWRTLTVQDIYEWTVGRLMSSSQPEKGRPLIRNFSGVVMGGEIML